MGEEGIDAGERDPKRCGGETDMSWCVARPDLSVDDETVLSFMTGAMLVADVTVRRSSSWVRGLAFADAFVFEEDGKAGAGWGCGGVAPEGDVTGTAITTPSALRIIRESLRRHYTPWDCSFDIVQSDVDVVSGVAGDDKRMSWRQVMERSRGAEPPFCS